MPARQTHTPNAINRIYPLHNANYNVTALVTAHTGPADTNDDGYADFGDYNAITSHFGHATGGGDAVGDLNHDGVVNADDETILFGNFGSSFTSSSWQVTERLAYNPYGAFTTSVLTVNADNTITWTSNANDYLAWNITFQGGRFDSLTRMVSFASSTFGRSENVDTGRWVSQDIGYLDSSNLYLFYAANPINRRDPTGLIDGDSDNQIDTSYSSGFYNGECPYYADQIPWTRTKMAPVGMAPSASTWGAHSFTFSDPSPLPIVLTNIPPAP